MARKILIEVWGATIEDALAIEEGGADRIELCGPGEGGVTPSIGLIQEIRQAVSINLNVMIRPRGGRREITTECFLPEEVEAMKEDIRMVAELGVDGLITGARKLKPGATGRWQNGVRIYGGQDTVVDVDTMDYLLEDVRHLSSTFHCGWGGRIEDLQEVAKIEGIHRVLHGPLDESKIRIPEEVERGEENIRRLMEAGGDKVAILAVTNMSFDVLGETLERLPLTEIYVGSGMGSSRPQRGHIDAQKVRLLRNFVDGL